jgi:hypothetical protein
MDQKVYVRKAAAGSTSHGYVWALDGAVVAVTPAEAAELFAIRDGGFSEVLPGDDDHPGFPAVEDAPPADPRGGIEVDPDPADITREEELARQAEKPADKPAPKADEKPAARKPASRRS